MRKIRKYKYYFIYKTTNLINGKIYVGQHSTNDFDDSYIGCGVYRQNDATENIPFHNSVRKYGYKNFRREIIELCKDREQLEKREIFWIKELNVTNNKIGYNITKGGLGGDTISSHPNREDIIRRSSIKRSKSMIGHIVSEETRQNIRNTLNRRPLRTCPYCNLQGISEYNMTYYHFDNCKKNPNRIITQERLEKDRAMRISSSNARKNILLKLSQKVA